MSLALAGLLLAGSQAASAADKSKSKVTTQATENEVRNTLAGLHDVNQTLLRWSQLGTEKGSLEVRNYAAMIAVEGKNLDSRVLAAASARKLALPPVYSTFYDLGRRIQLETLRVPAGKDFDHAYLAVAPKVQQEAVNQLGRLRAKTQDPELLGLINDHEKAIDKLVKQGLHTQAAVRAARRAPTK